MPTKTAAPSRAAAVRRRWRTTMGRSTDKTLRPATGTCGTRISGKVQLQHHPWEAVQGVTQVARSEPDQEQDPGRDLPARAILRATLALTVDTGRYRCRRRPIGSPAAQKSR